MKKYQCRYTKTILKYQNIIIMGDFNTDLQTQGICFNKLGEICDLLNLTNLIKSETCFGHSSRKSLIDLFLTNKPLSFQKTHVTEAGFSDYQKLIFAFLKPHFTRLRPKAIYYLQELQKVLMKTFFLMTCIN